MSAAEVAVVPADCPGRAELAAPERAPICRPQRGLCDVVIGSLIERTARSEGWAGLLAQARRHKLQGPVAAWLVGSAGAEAPEELRSAAARLLERTGHQSNRLVGELSTIVEVLRARGIRTLALKGPALATMLEGTWALRGGLDLDLLIAAADLEAAMQALGVIGYEARPLADGLARERHLVNHRRGFVVDLHWNIAGAEIPFGLDFGTLWAERDRAWLNATCIELPSRPWLAVLSSLYLVKEYPRIELRYLADLEALAPQLSPSELMRVEEIATATGTRRIVALAYMLLHRYGSTCQAPVIADAAVVRLAARVESAIADPGNDEKRRYWHRAAALASHAFFRERLLDRARVMAALPRFLLFPDMEDLGRASANGRSAWAVRLSRLPTVAADLWTAARPAERRVSARLDDLDARIRPTAGVELFLLDEAGFLLEPGRGELLALSHTATFLWCALKERMTLGEIIRSYAAAFRRSEQDARAEVRAAMLDWAGRGLLEGRRARTAGERTPGCTRPTITPIELVADRSFVILGTRFELRCECQRLLAGVDEVLGHFVPTGIAARRCEVELRAENQGWSLQIDGESRDWAPEAGAVPMLKHALIAEAANRYGFDLQVHAAMLRIGRSAMLLPASPGSGKTCLSVAMAAAGFVWHTDETTLLLGDDLRALGVPACPCVKELAWPILAPLRPGLMQRRIHRRVDEKVVRYALPPCDPILDATNDAWPVRWLIFPRFAADGGTRLIRLDRGEGLRRLLAETPAMRVRVDKVFVQRIMDWMCRLECYALEFDAFDSAIDALLRLTGTPGQEGDRAA